MTQAELLQEHYSYLVEHFVGSDWEEIGQAFQIPFVEDDHPEDLDKEEPYLTVVKAFLKDYFEPLAYIDEGNYYETRAAEVVVIACKAFTHKLAQSEVICDAPVWAGMVEVTDFWTFMNHFKRNLEWMWGR
jgi:hypothetical protein